MELDKSKGIALFTDGSSDYRDGSGGWAWVAIDCFDGIETGCGAEDDTTNNRMEMQAWVEGLNALHAALGPCEVLVYCDSYNIGKGFTGEYRRRSNVDLWGLLLDAADLHDSVEWIWVRGHGDSHYNCMADELASAARFAGLE